MKSSPPSAGKHPLPRPRRRIKTASPVNNPLKGRKGSDNMSVSYSIAGREIAPAEIGGLELLSDAIVAICSAVRKRVNGK